MREVGGRVVHVATEVEPSEAEWAAAIGFLTAIGKKCDDKRQEFILLSDVLGVSMLVDAVNIALQQNANILKGKSDLEAAYGVVIQTKAVALPMMK